MAISKNELYYSLDITKRQLNVIREALELMHRLLDGHVEHSLWNLFHHRDLNHDEFAAAVAPVRKMTHPDLEWNSYYGVGWRDDDRRLQASQIAYEIEAMIRHENWKRAGGVPRHSTSGSEPLHYSTEELVRLNDLLTDEKEKSLREYLRLVCEETMKFHKTLELLDVRIPENNVDEYSCLKGLIAEALEKAKGINNEEKTGN